MFSIHLLETYFTKWGHLKKIACIYKNLHECILHTPCGLSMSSDNNKKLKQTHINYQSKRYFKVWYTLGLFYGYFTFLLIRIKKCLPVLGKYLILRRLI